MYVIVRRDLSETYRMVQGAHALAQYAMDNRLKFEKWNNEYLIYLSVFNLLELENLYAKLLGNRKICSCFKEPDLYGHMTAIALYDTGEILNHLPLA